MLIDALSKVFDARISRAVLYNRFMGFCVRNILPLLLLLGISAHAKGGGGGGGKNPLALGVALNWAQPQPSFMGSSLNLSFGHTARLSFDMGVYAKTVGQTGGEMWLSSFAATIIWMVSLGNADWRKVYHAFSGVDESDIHAVMTVGGSVQAFVPMWKFSPTVGVGYASWIANPAESLDLGVEKGEHIYYMAGVDWAHENGFLGAGMTISPKLPSNRRLAPYVTAGVNWKF